MTYGTRLEPTPEEFEHIMQTLSEFAVSVIKGIPESKVADYAGAEEMALSLVEREPVLAELSELLATVDQAASKGMNHLHPGFLAFIPISGLPVGAIADFVAAILNRYVGMHWPSPAMAQLEWNAVEWIAKMFGYPDTARGTFTSGGSMANFSALVTARHAKLGSNHEPGHIYTTDQAHHSVKRAALLAGLHPDSLGSIPTNEDLEMDVVALERQLKEDRARGERPFMVVASGGTTNTGAVDPIGQIASVCEEYDVWLHVDAAYGGFFNLTERGRSALDGIYLADSITVDPHKGMFLPMGIGCVLVREGRHLMNAHAGEAAYLSDLESDGTTQNFADYSMELTRHFRGLRVWMALKLHGWKAFTETLDLNLDLAQHLYASLKEDDRFELPWEPRLSTVVFRLKDAKAGKQQELLEMINSSGEVFMSSTTIHRAGPAHGTWLRACFLSHRSTKATGETAIATILNASETISRADKETG